MKDKFSLFIVSRNARSSMQQLPIPKFVLGLAAFLVLFSFIFITIIASNVGYFGINQFLLAREEIKNIQFEDKLAFLNKFSLESKMEIERIFNFDDNIRLLYGMQALSKDLRQVGIGGTETSFEKDERLTEPHAKETHDLSVLFNKLLRQTDLELNSTTEIQKEIIHISKKLRRFPSVLPVFGQITSGFGYRFHPIERTYMNHDGLDIANAVWTPVYATADGVVASADYTSGYGNLIVLDHGYGTVTYYGHLQDYAVKKHQFVIRGDLIGYVGNSGRTTGPHLHYEIRKGNKPKDPLDFIYPISSLIN